MKNVLKLVLGVVLLVVVGLGGFLVSNKKSCCYKNTCSVGKTCNCPCTTKNNVLRWVKDPNLGTLYYGWYESDGSSFNYVATASRNHRMGNVQETNVPAHKWVQVD